MLFSHGNADDIGTCTAYCMWMAETFGVNVVTYDYRGYGHSCPGDGTEKDLCEFIEAALSDIDRHRKPENALILVGKSLGSVPTMYLAAHQHQKVDGVVIISGLATGARAFLQTPLIPDWIKKKFDDVFGNNIKQEKLIQCQVFVIHGTEDSVIPVQNAHLLLAHMHTNAYWPPLFIKAGHNDVELNGDKLFDSKLDQFLQHCETLHRAKLEVKNNHF